MIMNFNDDGRSNSRLCCTTIPFFCLIMRQCVGCGLLLEELDDGRLLTHYVTPRINILWTKLGFYHLNINA
jgi:hypothetical protein